MQTYVWRILFGIVLTTVNVNVKCLPIIARSLKLQVTRTGGLIVFRVGILTQHRTSWDGTRALELNVYCSSAIYSSWFDFTRRVILSRKVENWLIFEPL